MGLGFAAVGVGGIFIFPLLNLFIRRRAARAVLARDVIGFAFRCIVRSMRPLGVFLYDVKGLENSTGAVCSSSPTIRPTARISLTPAYILTKSLLGISD